MTTAVQEREGYEGSEGGSPPNDAPRSVLERNVGWVILAALILGCLLVIRPFFSSLLWAIVLCYSSWPVYQRILRAVGNRRTIAALMMTFGMVIVMLAPFVIVGLTMAGNVAEYTAEVRTWIDQGPPDPPSWLSKLPVVGPDATDRWKHLQSDTTQLWKAAKRFVEPVSAWALGAAMALGGGLLQLALSILIALFLFRDGAAAAERLQRMIGRVAGENGKRLLGVAGSTVRGVVHGILGTSLIQAVLASFGYLIVGVHGVGLLGMLTFFASVVPVFGTALIWLPVAFWLFSEGATGWGIFMLIWGAAVGNIDGFVRPLLISQGSDLPFILILFGVLGGALTFGFIGIFLGPTLLAVGFRLVEEWTAVVQTASDSATTVPPPAK